MSKVVVVKPEVVVYFGLVLVKSEFVVAESGKRVTAIFLLPVWPLEPPGRSFLPYSGPYDCSIADVSYVKIGCNKSKSVDWK